MKDENMWGPDKLAYANIEAEESCLGAALQDARSVEMLKRMDIQDFTKPEHRVLYSAITETDAKGMPVDLVTIHSVLSGENKLETIGGDAWLMRLMNAVPTTVNMGYYVRLVQECRTRRRLKELGEGLVAASGRLDQDPGDIRERAAVDIREVKGAGGAAIVSQQDAMIRTYDRMDRMQHREGQPSDRIMTGILPLDRMTGGLYGSKLVIIGARPSVGKSVFAMTICLNAAKQGKKVLYISLEMEPEEIMERQFAAETLVPLTEITGGAMQEGSWEKITGIMPELSRMPVCYCTEIHTVEDVRKAAFRMYENGGLDLVCVDYIQLLKTAQKRSSRQEEVADISRGLKWLAQELKIPVIALSQLNRSSQREKRPPTMAEARESGAIEQDANIFLLLHDTQEEELRMDCLREAWNNLRDNGMKMIHVNVEKNRQGKGGVFYLAFDGDHMRFLPLRIDKASWKEVSA